MKMLKINKKEMVDVAIAALTVKNAPRILGALVPTFATGLTGNIAGGVLAYVLGMVLRKPTVSNVGLALALVDVVQDVAIEPAVNMVMPGNTAPALQARATRSLREYVSAPRGSVNYAQFYN